MEPAARAEYNQWFLQNSEPREGLFVCFFVGLTVIKIVRRSLSWKTVNADNDAVRSKLWERPLSDAWRRAEETAGRCGLGVVSPRSAVLLADGAGPGRGECFAELGFLSLCPSPFLPLFSPAVFNGAHLL